MTWFSWLRRKPSKTASVLAANTATGNPASVPSAQTSVHVPGRETVATGESHYMVPNDEREAHRLNLQHTAFFTHFGKHVFAPIQRPARILDAASGTGRWAEDIKASLGEVAITGIDVTTPLTVREHGQPQAYTFVQGNLLEPLPFPDASFDFVHMRLIYSAMPVTKWPEVVRELLRVTAAGGWIELVEANLPRDGGPALTKIVNWSSQGLALRGVDVALGSQIGEYLRAAGATGVTEQSAAIPIGVNSDRVGQMLAMDVLTGFLGAAPIIAQIFHIDQREIDETIRQAEAEIYDPRYHIVYPVYIAYGQRP